MALRPPGGLLRSRSARLLAAFGFFVVTTAIWFGPILPDLGTRVPGRASDGTSALRYFWAAEQHGVTPFELKRDLLVGAPEGSAGDPGLGAVGPIQPAFVMLLEGALGLVTAWNIFILLGFVLSGFLMFGVLDRLGFNFGAAIFGGYVFAFNPWHFEKAFEGHGRLVQTWIVPLVLWALVSMRSRGGLGSVTAAGVVLGASFLVDPYLFLFACAIVLVFTAVHVVSPPPDRRRSRSLVEGAAVFGVAAAIVAPIALVLAKVSDVADVDRDIRELQAFGAAPLAYVVPSERHPLFGSTVAGLWSEADPRHFAEPTLFFGYTTLLLALATLVGFAWRGRFARDRRFVVCLGAALVVTGFYASLPRVVEVMSISIPSPSYAMGEITTLWRVYSRFAVVVSLGLVLLAACAVHAVTGRRPWLTLPLLGTVAFELAAGAPIQTWSTEPPDHVRWLASQPFGIVAHYPMLTYAPAETRMQTEEFFHQTAHGHPLYAALGGGRLDLGARVVRVLSKDLADPATPGVLAARSVRYVVVHDDVYRELGVRPPRAPENVLRRVFAAGDTTVFEVEAPAVPIEPLVEQRPAEIAATLGAAPALVEVGKDGFAGLWFENGITWQRLVQDGALKIDNPRQAEAWTFRLRTVAFSPGRPRDVVLTDTGGRVVGRAAVGTSQQPLVLGPFALPTGRSLMRLHVEPAPSDFDTVGATGLLLLAPRLEAVFDAGASATIPERVPTEQLVRFSARR